MRMGRLVLATAVGILVAVPARAQQAPPQNTVLQVHRVTPKPGMRTQFEAGTAKHMQWHKAQGDSWVRQVWMVMSGPNTGSYLVTVPGHTWNEFDGWNAKLGKGDGADVALNIEPHAEASTSQYWVMLADASRAMGGETAPLGTLTTYRVKAGKIDQFRQALRTIRDGLEKGNFERRALWFSLVSGGPTRTFAVFTPRASMAEMALPQLSMREVLEREIGRSQTGAVLDVLDEAFEDGSSELLQFRPDLSYLPKPAS